MTLLLRQMMSFFHVLACVLKVASTNLKMGSLPIIRSTSIFQGMFENKFNSYSGWFAGKYFCRIWAVSKKKKL